MSSPFYFPDEDSRYQGMFQENYRQGPSSQYDYSSYLDPEDEEVRKLRELYSRPSGASELVREYIGKRPDQADYNPSFGRKLLAFVGGTFGGGDGYNRSRQILNQPYTDDYRSWTDEGKFIDDQVRLLEADRNREIAAVKLGIQEKGKVLAGKNRNTTSAFNFAQRGVGQQLQDQDRDLGREQRASEFDIREKRMTDQFNTRIEEANEREKRLTDQFNSMMEWRKNQDNEQSSPVKELANEKAIDELVLRKAETVPQFKPIMDYIKMEQAKGRTPNLIAFGQSDPNIGQLVEYFRDYLRNEATLSKAERAKRGRK